MLRRSRWPVFGLVLACVAAAVPARAARPLLDYHRLDAYFALYAHDSNVPWKSATVRLDTYTSAPIDFSVYQVDPANVLVAGSTTQPRAIDTRSLRAAARWQYAPPGGYRFQSNDVPIPLGSRQGFFVVEARRGNVGEQVWINRTRIGLLSKETTAGITLYGADLGTGNPLPHMRVSLIVNGRFTDRYTDASGVLVWRARSRPIFAMAQWGAGMAFLSFLPEAPLPSTIVGVKTASAVVHAGEDLQIVGFARSRGRGRLRASGGGASVLLRSAYGTAAQISVPLDRSGAFTATLHVPPYAHAGDYAVIATVGGASAGAAVHVDANAGGLSLSLAPQCEGRCAPDADIPVVVRATRTGLPAAGVPVSATIVRSPHVYLGAAPERPWGVAQWYSTTVISGRDGRALVEIPRPSDGLASTYGVRVRSGGATADTRVVVPTSRIALRLALDRDDVGIGMPASFDVYVHDVATAQPVPGMSVRVQLVHGSSVQEQVVTLDARGHARGVFRSPQVGSNLILARAAGTEPAMDAAQLQVEPQTLQTQNTAGSQTVRISLDRDRYAAGEQTRMSAYAAGARGSAMITLESASGTQIRIVPVVDGRASAALRIGEATGVLAAGAVFVRDGALVWDSEPLVVDAPGCPLIAPLTLDRSAYTPGSDATARMQDVRPGDGTVIVRITKGAPTGSALFASAPDLLAIGTTTTQDTAAEEKSWHPWVASTGNHAIIQSFVRRSAPPPDLTMTQADTANLYWKVERETGNSLRLPVPAAPGNYVLSVLKVCDDGRVTAASTDLIVR